MQRMQQDLILCEKALAFPEADSVADFALSLTL